MSNSHPYSMAVTITQTDADQLHVNGKLVYKNVDNNWQASTELTRAEEKALHQHLRTLEQ